ncbi:putative Haemagg_act domain-containing protein [Gammaproteobacteria bacterium]
MLRLYTLCRNYLIVLLGVVVVLISISVKALPQGGSVVSGDITINSGSNVEIIKQQSQKGIIDWQSFNIGSAERTQFIQPGASSVTLNRVTGGDVSSILGQLIANGQIFIVNPAGIIFGPNSRVDVAGLLATTADISNANFLAGNYNFVQGSGSASIINRGSIIAADNGHVYLVAPRVDNSGLIQANLGKVILGSTPANSVYTLDFYGDELIKFALSSGAGSNIDNAITQSGKIIANGGLVLLTANTVKGVVNNAINMSGVVEANTIASRGGTIILSGGRPQGIVSVAGKVIARGNKTGEKGGKVKITGEKVGLFEQANIDVSGMFGGGEVLIGAEYLGGNIIPAAQSVYVGPNANIFANAITSGNGGKTIVWSDKSTRFYGTAEAKGGAEGGNGGFVETSSKNWLDISGAHVDVSAANGVLGTLLLDPYDVYIVGTGPSTKGDWSGSGIDPRIWTPNDNDSQLYVQDIVTKLGLANVQITTGSTGTQSGNIYLNAALNYTGASTLSLIAANNIEINAAITGANLNLVLQAGAAINISNNGINVKSLATQGASVTNINANAITTALSQTYNTPVVLGADTTLTTGTGGDITFASTLDSDTTPRALTLTGITGNTTFGGAVGATNLLSSLLTGATGTTYVNGTAVKTSGNQTYGNAVVLGADTAFSASNITFSSTLNSDTTPRALTLTGITGNTTFGGAVGATNLLSSLLTGATGTTYVNGTAVKTSGNQTYGNAVVLGADTAFSASNITFSSTLNSDTTPRALTLTGITGNTTFGGAVGATNLLSSLLTGATGTTYVNGTAVKTSGNQTYGNAVVLGADTAFSASNITFSSTLNSDTTPRALTLTGITGNTTFGGAVGATNLLSSLLTGATGTTYVNGTAVKTSGNQTYGNAVVLGADTAFSASNITFSSTLNSDTTPRALTLTGITGNTTFGGAVGATNLLSSLLTGATGTTYVNGTAVKTSGNQTYGNAVVLGADTAFSASNITFSSTLNSDTTPRALTLTGITGNTTFGGAVGATNLLSSLLTGATGTTYVNGTAVKTSGNQTYGNAVVLGADTAFSASNITFSSTLNSDTTPRALTLTGITGNTTFGGAVGATNLLSSLLTGATGTTYVNGTAVKTSGNQTYGNAVVLGADTAFSASNITFSSTLNSDTTPRALTLTGITGNTTFGGAVGATNLLSSLLTGATGTTYVNGTAVKTSGNQTYGNAVVLGADTAFSASNITFSSTLNSDTTPRALTLTGITGNTTFGGAVGATNLLSSLLTGATGTTYVNGTAVKTSGNQTYGNAVVLGADTAFSASNITFSSTLNSDTTPRALTLTGITGNTTFGGAVGATNLLSSLLTGATGTTYVNGTAVKTSGNQTYGNAVVLGADTAFSASNITFSSTLNSDTTPRALTLTGITGNTTFGGAVGATNLLSSLLTGATGTTYVNGTAVKTSGNQTYGNAVVLGADTAFSASNITFSSTLNSDTTPRALTLTGITGNTTFGGAVGATNLLSSLLTGATGTTYVNGTAVKTSGNQTYGNAVVLGADTAFSASNITFSSTLNSDTTPRALTLTGITGNTTFGGAVGATNLLSSLLTGATGTTYVNGTAVKTSGNQTYGNAVVLGADTAFSASNITFSSTLNSDTTPRALTLTGITGNTTFGGAVGATNLLSSLLTGATGTTYVNGTAVKTSGNQTYGNAVVLGADTAFSASNITFSSTLNSDTTPRALTLTGITGNTTFGGAVGATNLLSSLLTGATGTTYVNGTAVKTSGNQTYGNAVVLGADTAFSASNITFSSTLNSDTTPRALTLTGITGNTTFGGAVGATNLLSSLLTGATGTTYVNGTAVKTSGNQTYGNAVVLGADTAFSASNITFSSTLNSDTTPRALTLTGITGNTTFGGAVGATNALSSLTTATTGTTYINGGSINTTGLQNYQAPVILGTGATLTGGAITFNSTVNSAGNFPPSSLTLNATGNIKFYNMVGGNSPLQNLIVNSGCVLYFYGQWGITTTGFQTYNAAISSWNGTTTLTTSNNNITFNSTVTGPNNLLLNVGSGGNVLFNGAVGVYAYPIGLLYITNANNVTANAGVYVMAFAQMAGSGTTSFNNILYAGRGSTAGFIHGDGQAIIETNRVIANIDVGVLYLGVNSAQLTGFIGGSSDMSAAKNIKELNPFSPGTHYYNGIDLYGLSPTTVIDNSLMQELLASLYGNFNFGFGYEFLGPGNNQFDYLFLLNPPECTVEEES